MNFQEHPQSMLLTDSILPVLRGLHPDGQFAIGQDCGIYWRLPQGEEPAYRAAVAPDWFVVEGVPPTLEGQVRRSYVMWQEFIAPLIVIEFVSGDGTEERDRTPKKGKFWIYEQVLRIPYYAIYEVNPGRVEVYHLVDSHYERMPANGQGRFPIAPLGVELGIWKGHFVNMELPWLRWWDSQGNLLPTAEEQIKAADERARAAEAQAQRLAERLRALGVDPEQV